MIYNAMGLPFDRESSRIIVYFLISSPDLPCLLLELSHLVTISIFVRRGFLSFLGEILSSHYPPKAYCFLFSSLAKYKHRKSEASAIILAGRSLCTVAVA